jgi:hypothetical protein
VNTFDTIDVPFGAIKCWRTSAPTAPPSRSCHVLSFFVLSPNCRIFPFLKRTVFTPFVATEDEPGEMASPRGVATARRCALFFMYFARHSGEPNLSSEAIVFSLILFSIGDADHSHHA